MLVSSTLGGLVIAQGSPVVISDITADARVPAETARAAGGRAYAGYPIRDVDGAITGVCAVLDREPRMWRPEHLSALDQGAQACTAFVIEQHSAARADDARRLLAALLDSLQTGVAACDAAGRLVFSNRANQDLNGELPHDVDLRAAARTGTLPPGHRTTDARPGRRASARRGDRGRTAPAAALDTARRRPAHHQRRR